MREAERSGGPIAWAGAFVCAVMLCAQPAGAEIIDRMLAVVGRELITLSDVSGALRLGLVRPAVKGGDPVRTTLDALIARELQLAEANRYGPPDPSDAQVQARVDVVAGRFPTAAAFEEALAQSGLTADRLRLRLRDDLRIATYLDQRFGVLVQPSDETLLDFYRTHQASFMRRTELRPFAEARDEARLLWLAEQRNPILTEWLEGLRRRTEVTDLYAVAPPSARIP